MKAHRVFGRYPVADGYRFAFLEVDGATFRRFKRKADRSGLSVGEEITLAMERRGLSAETTGHRCALAGKEAA